MTAMNGGKGRLAGLLFGVSLLLVACTAQQREALSGDDASGINTPPTQYKADIAAAMHSYLNDPTGIRDAAVSPPALKTTAGNVTRYIACVQFNPKKNAREYAGVKTIAAVFLGGRFDHFVDLPKTECTGAALAPFPELQKLPP
jgi:hypothetical protein